MPRSFPALLLRTEALAGLAFAIGLYAWQGGSPLFFAAFFLAPDLAALAYVAGPRVGAVAYNLAHTWSLSLALLAAGLLRDGSTAVSLALVWLAHIAFDRLIGYGLKYPTAFKDTHLARV